MDCLPKKMAVVERWPLVEVRMYFLSVWSSLSYTHTLYLSVFLFYLSTGCPKSSFLYFHAL